VTQTDDGPKQQATHNAFSKTTHKLFSHSRLQDLPNVKLRGAALLWRPARMQG
jgi:hypothetical protein